MINISEICIGNILHPDAADETLVATVKSLDESKIGFYEYSSVIPAQAAPVSLSEIWLKGYSFAYSAETRCWSKGGMVLQAGGEGYLFSMGTHSQILKFVHQLQNLYFCLFHEILRIELVDGPDASEIQLAADSIMVNYLPKNRDAATFSFRLTVEGSSYDVWYKKDVEGYWAFYSYSKLT